MAEPDPILEEVPAGRRRRLHPIVRGLLSLILFVLLLGAMAVAFMDTGPGHRLIIDRIAAIAPSSGLRIRIGRIDGSIWNRATIRDLRLYDTAGLFLEAPEIDLEWRPFGWLANRLELQSVRSDLLILHRLPRLKPTTRKGPLLPGFDIHVGRLQVQRLRLGEKVAGQARSMRIDAGADIRHGRAVVKLMADSTAGDRLKLLLDAEPDRDRFDIEAKVTGPADGVFSRLSGLGRPIDGLITGDGTWSAWKGGATLDLGDARGVDLGLGVDHGKYALQGQLVLTSLLKGKLQRLTAPRILINGAATLADRRLDGNIAIETPEIAFAGSGTLDLAQ
ncbi:MAG: hypothetical protein JWR77_237, partial [Rhizorhabdus sp.]|nr:hypothetical protein [Rhizorhabdus sp.]